MEHWKIKGYDVAYEDETHKYYVNGEEVPSITTIMKIKFKDKYKDYAFNWRGRNVILRNLKILSGIEEEKK